MIIMWYDALKIDEIFACCRFVSLESFMANNKNQMRQSTPLSDEACQFIGLKQVTNFKYLVDKA
jgi:hypothetical protein